MLWLEKADCRFLKWDLPTYKRYLPYLARYLSTLLARIGRTERRIATAQYIEGLLLPGRRKFIRPLAERLNVDSQSLQQAIAHSPWDDQEVWSAIRSEIIPLLEPMELWVINERAWTKQGQSTVAVANQRCGANGKKSHCQVSIELLVSDGSVSAPAAGRLYLPENWATDSTRRQRTEIPEDINFSTKPALAVQLIKEALRDAVQPGTVIADSCYGNDAEFRLSLLYLGLEFFVEIDPSLNQAWDFDSTTPQNDMDMQVHPCGLDAMISGMSAAEWKHCSWTGADGITRRTRLAVREIFLDCGSYDIQGESQKLWLVVDWPAGDSKPYRCYLAHFHRPPSETKCLRLSRYRGYNDFYHECFDRVLDLACYQGRSWKGFHHHLVLAAAAYLFILTIELRNRRPFWPGLREDHSTDRSIALETSRFTSVLLRSGSPADRDNPTDRNDLTPTEAA